jgi:hypothetical protein
METSWLSKIKGWLAVGIPAVIGLAVAVVMRKSPVAKPATKEIKGPDMKAADDNAKNLEKEQQVLAEQHKSIEQVLVPKPAKVNPNTSLEDAVTAYNKDK